MLFCSPNGGAIQWLVVIQCLYIFKIFQFSVLRISENVRKYSIKFLLLMFLVSLFSSIMLLLGVRLVCSFWILGVCSAFCLLHASVNLQLIYSKCKNYSIFLWNSLFFSSGAYLWHDNCISKRCKRFKLELFAHIFILI